MKSEEIKKEIAVLEAQIRALRGQVNKKNNELAKAVASERGLNVGDRVRVFREFGYGEHKATKIVGEGIFGGMVIRYGEARPIVYKIKKDGAVSKQEFSIYSNDSLEKA